MKTLILLFLTLLPWQLLSQPICNAAGNLAVFSNYDGGILTINVDQNIPNLKIGICTYEPVQVTITGPFVSNVTQVIYAGFNSAQNNNNCGQGNFPTSITGVPSSIVTINPAQNPPQVGYTPAHGNGSGPWGGGMIGAAGLCDTNTNAGGGNTPDEIVFYFEDQTGGELYFHHTQYNCWLNQTLSLSGGGTCCIQPSTPTIAGCDPNGNVIVYSNYEGGVLNINVDQNIPNLKVGICTYEATEVNFSGPFVGNITEVIYAGFDGPNNTSCGANIPTTVINGVSPSIVTIYSGSSGNPAIANYFGEPVAPGFPPLVNCMVGADGDCSASNSGGGNSSPQIVQFFLAEFGAGSSLFSHTTDYSCFSGTYNVSSGGNCCLTTPTTPANPIYTGGATYDFIPDSYSLCNGPLTLDLSFYPVLFQPPTYPGYVWSDGTTGPVITITQPGTYSFTVGDYCHYDTQFLLTDTIVVSPCCTPPNDPTASATQQPTCAVPTGTIVISDPIGANLEYSIDGVNYQTSTTFSGLAPGTYNITVMDAITNCVSTGIITVTITVVSNAPVITVQSTTLVTCFGSADGAATIQVTGGSPPYAYSWSPNGGNAASATGLSAGTYTVTTTDNTGCNAVQNVVIGTPSVITITETISPVNCGSIDGAITTAVSGGTGTYNYSWSPSGAITSSISNLVPGNYSLTVTDQNGCQVNETYTVSTIGNLPVTISPTSVVISAGDTVALSASGGLTYNWSPSSGLSCSDCPDPDAFPTESTIYTVTVTDASGCSGSESSTIIVERICGEVFVPTIFSPNGTGPEINNTLCVFGGCLSNLTFIIYNRWGEKVFETEDQLVCWNGEFKGKLLNSGSFVYKLQATKPDGSLLEQSGNITLVR
jgi:gliding motility-associated-like protein